MAPMSVKSEIKGVIGKTIAGVLVAQNTRQPNTQVFLVFSDGTYYEFYGCVNSAAGVDRGGMAEVKRYARAFEGGITKYE
jgi:hypothetical protein